MFPTDVFLTVKFGETCSKQDIVCQTLGTKVGGEEGRRCVHLREKPLGSGGRAFPEGEGAMGP